MQLIILSIVTGFIGTAIYGFWLQGREPEIKHSLALARRSVSRKRRVRAYVSAIKGEFEVESSKRAVIIQIEVTIVMIVVLLLLSFTLTSVKRDSVHSLGVANTFLTAKGQKVESAPEPTVPEALALKARAQSLLRYTDVVVRGLLFGFIPIATVYYGWLLLVRLPYVQRRSAFLVRLERLRRILPSVCDKDELVELLLLEHRTSGEESLRRFASGLVHIGTKHGLLDLVSEFELWPKKT